MENQQIPPNIPPKKPESPPKTQPSAPKKDADWKAILPLVLGLVSLIFTILFIPVTAMVFLAVIAGAAGTVLGFLNYEPNRLKTVSLIVPLVALILSAVIAGMMFMSALQMRFSYRHMYGDYDYEYYDDFRD